jgi:hypothetical protein
MKIVINICFGGFSFSTDFKTFFDIPIDSRRPSNESLGLPEDDYISWRAHPKLITALEAFGLEKASGVLSRLKIVEIPDDVIWEIENYDGSEVVREVSRVWE